MFLNVVAKMNAKENDSALEMIKGIFVDPHKAKIYYDSHNSDEEPLDLLYFETQDGYIIEGEPEDYKFVLAMWTKDQEEDNK